jgi:hypothetical protein
MADGTRSSIYNGVEDPWTRRERAEKLLSDVEGGKVKVIGPCKDCNLWKKARCPVSIRTKAEFGCTFFGKK